MRTVWKYTMKLREEEGLLLGLPTGNKLVGIAMIPNSHHELGFWFELDTELPGNEQRCFTVLGTGHPIADNLVHRCTVRDEQFVWHVYEEVNGLPSNA